MANAPNIFQMLLVFYIYFFCIFSFENTPASFPGRISYNVTELGSGLFSFIVSRSIIIFDDLY